MEQNKENVFYCYINFFNGDSTKYTNIKQYNVLNNVVTIVFYNGDVMLLNFNDIQKIRFMIQGQIS